MRRPERWGRLAVAARRTALRIGVAVTMAAFLVGPAVGDADAPQSAAARAAYWLDRLLLGPDGPSLGIPHYHQNLLVDAQKGLVDVREATLERLADEGLRERVTSSGDTNAWHGILGVLIQIGPDRPQVARAWAAPALQQGEVTLRRLAAGVFSALRAPEDVAVLLEALRRDAADRMIAPALMKTLVSMGPSAAAVAARFAYGRLPVDGGEGSSVWNSLPNLLEQAHGGPFDDVLAWWGLLTDGSGPRAPDPVAVRGQALPRIDPDRMAVLARAHFLTDGRRATAESHALLALRGRPTATAAIHAEAASGDPLLRASAARVLAKLRLRAGTDREAVRTRAGALLNNLPELDKADPAEVVDLAEALRVDESPEARDLLVRLFAAMPTLPAWRATYAVVHDGIVVRGGDPAPRLEVLLRSAQPREPELALFLIRRSRDPRYVDVLERWYADPASAPMRPRLRRELIFLVVASLSGTARIPPDRLAAFAASVRGWAEDPRDPSAGGLVSALFDLGAPGQAELAAGLAGPRRGIFVDALRGAPLGRLDPAGMAALLAPLGRDTPPAERAMLLQAVYFTAGGSAVPALQAARMRLHPDARAEADALLRMIRNRGA